MLFRVVRAGFEQHSVRILKSDNKIRVGEFIRLEEGGLYQGDFLVVALEPPKTGWGISRHECLVLHRLGLSQEARAEVITYELIARAEL